MRNKFRWFPLLGFCFVAAVMMPGCGSIAKEYVDADRKTFEAIEPEYRKYVENDAGMSEEDKALRLANLDSWDYRISQAEKAGDK